MYVEKRLTCEEMLKLYYNENLSGKKIISMVLFKSDNGLTFNEEGVITVFLKTQDQEYIIDEEFYFKCLMETRYTILVVRKILDIGEIGDDSDKFTFLDRYSL